MSRKENRVTITAEGRDKGKVFVLHEMPSDLAERWFIRLVLALAHAGAKVPEEMLFGGVAGFAEMLPTLRNSLVVAIRSIRGLDYKEIDALLTEMVPYITWQPPGFPAPPEQPIFQGAASQIEEVSTWLLLRFELVQLHVGFSLAAGVQTTESDSPIPEASAAS